MHTSTTGRRLRAGRVALVLLATVGLATSSLVANASAAEAIPGLQIIPDTSDGTSSSFKLMNIPCPGTTAGIGGDVEITGSTQVRVQGIYPSEVNVGFLVVEPAGGVAEPWSFTAHAYCAPRSSLPGLQYVSATNSEVALARATTTTSANARCVDSNKRVIGMGAEAYGETAGGQLVRNNVTLIQLWTAGPVGDGGWDVLGAAAAYGFDGTFTVNTVAVCVDRTRLPSLVWARAESPRDSAGDKLVRASCAGYPGTTLHGGGFTLQWSTPDDVGPHIGVNRLAFRNSGGGNQQTVELIAREDTAGTPANWQAHSVVICA